MDNLVLLLVATVVWTSVAVVAYRLLSRPSEARKRFKAGSTVGLPHGDFTANVARIIDGDTVDVVTHGRKFRIRLDAIDCPEDGQDWGDTAKYGLIKLIGGKTVHLENHGVDIYGRILATIYLSKDGGAEQINVNERMVALGSVLN